MLGIEHLHFLSFFCLSYDMVAKNHFNAIGYLDDRSSHFYVNLPSLQNGEISISESIVDFSSYLKVAYTLFQ